MFALATELDYGGWFAGTWRSSSSAQRSPAGDCRQGLIWQLMTAKNFGCDRMRTMALHLLVCRWEMQRAVNGE